jgi:hypothetical protein
MCHLTCEFRSQEPEARILSMRLAYDSNESEFTLNKGKEIQNLFNTVSVYGSDSPDFCIGGETPPLLYGRGNPTPTYFANFARELLIKIQIKINYLLLV